jgi:nitroreductase
MTPLLDLTVDEVLTTTRNVRKRLDFDRPVPRELVAECVDIAVQAPTGSNNQEWEWIAVDDLDLRRALADLHRDSLAAYLEHVAAQLTATRTRFDGARNERFEQISESVMYLIENFERAPVLMVPVIRTPVRPEAMGHNFYLASTFGSIIQAVWSFMLALRARGLGSAWTTLQLWRERETADLIGVPYDTSTQVGLFPIAYTLGPDFRPAQRAGAATVLHWNRLTGP